MKTLLYVKVLYLVCNDGIMKQLIYTIMGIYADFSKKKKKKNKKKGAKKE